MNSGVTAALMQLINAAVTPVVLISACAAIILGINNKHTAISDRLRLFAAELRAESLSESRREQLLEQLNLFYQRYRYTWMALASLYTAVISFVLMVLVILLEQKNLVTRGSNFAPLALFVVGIILILIAVTFELTEIRLSLRSLDVEIRDVRVM